MSDGSSDDDSTFGSIHKRKGAGSRPLSQPTSAAARPTRTKSRQSYVDMDGSSAGDDDSSAGSSVRLSKLKKAQPSKAKTKSRKDSDDDEDFMSDESSPRAAKAPAVKKGLRNVKTNVPPPEVVTISDDDSFVGFKAASKKPKNAGSKRPRAEAAKASSKVAKKRARIQSSSEDGSSITTDDASSDFDVSESGVSVSDSESDYSTPKKKPTPTKKSTTGSKKPAASSRKKTAKISQPRHESAAAAEDEMLEIFDFTQNPTGDEPVVIRKGGAKQADSQRLTQHAIGDETVVVRKGGAKQADSDVIASAAVVSPTPTKKSRKTDAEGGAKAASSSSTKMPSSLPLMLPKTLRSRTTALVQMEEPGFDLSGDMGAIGRLNVLPHEGVILDLKGHQYAGTIVPCCTFMVVGLGPTEAKVEGMVSDFIQLDHLANVLESLSGHLQAGEVDPALLRFEDVDGDGEAQAILRARSGDSDGEDGAGGNDLADDNSDSDASGDNDAKKPTTKRKRADKGDKVYGRTVKVGKRGTKTSKPGKKTSKAVKKTTGKSKASKSKTDK